MGFISKVELKKQLQAMGVKVEGNYVRKSELEKITASDPYFYWNNHTPSYSEFFYRRLRAESPEAKRMIGILYDKIKDEETFDKVFSNEVWQDNSPIIQQCLGVYDELIQDLIQYLKKTLPNHVGYFREDGRGCSHSIWPVDLQLVLKNLEKI